MSEITPTADLYDEHGDALQSCDLQFTQYGERTRFQGTIITVRCHEDNALLKTIVQRTGRRQGPRRRRRRLPPLRDDRRHDRRHRRSNGWEGVIINGAIRDAAALADIDLGVKALGTNPRKSHKHGAGQHRRSRRLRWRGLHPWRHPRERRGRRGDPSLARSGARSLLQGV